MTEPAGLGDYSDVPNRKYRNIAGRRIAFDIEDFFWDANDWSEEVAEVLARESGLEVLGERHRQVLGFLREYYFSQGRAPLNRQLREGTGLSLLTLEGLFPRGIKYGARRIAGLPNPRNCA